MEAILSWICAFEELYIIKQYGSMHSLGSLMKFNVLINRIAIQYLINNTQPTTKKL